MWGEERERVVCVCVCVCVCKREREREREGGRHYIRASHLGLFGWRMGTPWESDMEQSIEDISAFRGKIPSAMRHLMSRGVNVSGVRVRK